MTISQKNYVLKQINEVKKLLELPYPKIVGKSQINNCILEVNNFFRNSPFRKIVLIQSSAGEYNYEKEEGIDEDEQEQLHMGIFNMVRENLSNSLQEYNEYDFYHPNDLALCKNYFDKDKEGSLCLGENVGWTSSYEGGAAYPGATKAEIVWDIGNEYLLLAIGRQEKGNNFKLYTFATITPKVKHGFDGVKAFENERRLDIIKGKLEKKGDTFQFLRFGVKEKPIKITHIQLELYAENCIPQEIYEATRIREMHIIANRSLLGKPLFNKFINLEKLEFILNGHKFYEKELIKAADSDFLNNIINEPLERVVFLGISTDNPILRLDHLKGISKWKNLDTFKFEYSRLLFLAEDFESFVKEINISKIKELYFRDKGSLKKDELRDEHGRALSSFFLNIDASWY